MIKLIRSNTPLNYALMFLLMLVLWGFKFYYMPTPIETYEVSNWLIPKIPETIFYKYLSAILSFATLYVFAILIIRLNSRLAIIENAYQSPGILFVILTGIYINVQRFLPETAASFALYFAIMRIFYSYNKKKAYSNLLDAGIFTAIAIFLFHKLVFSIPIIIIIIVILRPVKWRELLIYFVGLIVTFSVGITIIWMFGEPDVFFSSLNSAIGTKYTSTKYTALSGIMFIPILAITSLSVLSRYTINIPRKVSTRKFQTASIIILVVLAAFFVSPHSTNESIVMLYPFLSLLLANIIINAKKVFVYITFWGLIISLLFSQSAQILYYLSLY